MTTKIGSRPNIALDVSPLSNANAQRGVGFYTSRLVTALQHVIQTNPTYHNWHITLIENSELKTQKNQIYDLIHYPFFDPFELTLPAHKTIPTVTTVHDLIPRKFRTHYPVGVRGEFKWLIQRHRLNQSDYILTDSYTSKYDIKDLVGYPEEQIYVTYLAADSVFKPLSKTELRAKASRLIRHYHLPKNFVLYVGDINWNKNIPNLVRACTKLGYPLVIAGSAATQTSVPTHPWTVDLRWLQHYKQQTTNHQLLLPGFVSTEDLVVLYNLATLYCQPSFYEGFGLPALEAMSCACPVVYSKEASLSEVVHFQGESFDPYNQSDLATVLSKVWNDPKLRTRLAKRGLARARMFTWEKTALETLGVYELALLAT